MPVRPSALTASTELGVGCSSVGGARQHGVLARREYSREPSSRNRACSSSLAPAGLAACRLRRVCGRRGLRRLGRSGVALGDQLRVGAPDGFGECAGVQVQIPLRGFGPGVTKKSRDDVQVHSAARDKEA